MSEDKTKSPEVEALENQVEDLKEQIEKLSAYPELLQTEKDLREKTLEQLKQAEDKLESIKEWAAGFERFGDSDYKGIFISDEITKVLNKEKKSGNKNTS